MRLPRQLLPLLLLCLATATASAQLTWMNLHFGESRDDVSAQLSNLNIPAESSPDGALQANSDYNLPLPGLLYPIPVMASFHFDTHNALADIALTLDIPAMRHNWAAVGSDQALYNFAADQLTLALAGRYGTPTFSSASCNSTAETLPSPCAVLWRGNAGSTIELERASTHKGPRLRILYLPTVTDL